MKLPGVGSPVSLGSKEIAPANPSWGLESLTLGRPATVSAPPPAQLDFYDLSAIAKGLMKLELNGDAANGDLVMLSSLAKLKSLVIKNCRGVSVDREVYNFLPALSSPHAFSNRRYLPDCATACLLQEFLLALSCAG